MKTLITDHFILNYQDELENFINDSLDVFSSKINFIKTLFNADLNKKIKVSFFTDRNAFVAYIKFVSNGNTPPDWATGCFYNGEIQTLINLNNVAEVNLKKHLLTHEFVHLYFNELIYNKNNIYRIRWFDEAYAKFIDGSETNKPVSHFKTIANKLKLHLNFDVNQLNDSNKIITKDYNGYEMFSIIGKYIFENNLHKKLLNELLKNQNTVINLGTSILKLAIDYIDSL